MIAVLGAQGQLGSAFVRLLGSDALAVTRSHLDLLDLGSIGEWVANEQPDLIINCAAYTAVDEAESDPATARSVNATAVGSLATAASRHGVKLITFSTDFVFDGTAPLPYVESDMPNPLNVYGRSKLEGEKAALEADPTCLVVRTSWVLSGTHRNFASLMVNLISKGPVKVVDDQMGRPTIADDLAAGVMQAYELKTSGVLHLTNRGKVTRYHLAREIAQFAGLDPSRVEPVNSRQYPSRTRRPANSVLDSERLQDLGMTPLPHYRDSLEGVVRQIVART